MRRFLSAVLLLSVVSGFALPATAGSVEEVFRGRHLTVKYFFGGEYEYENQGTERIRYACTYIAAGAGNNGLSFVHFQSGRLRPGAQREVTDGEPGPFSCVVSRRGWPTVPADLDQRLAGTTMLESTDELDVIWHVSCRDADPSDCDGDLMFLNRVHADITTTCSVTGLGDDATATFEPFEHVSYVVLDATQPEVTCTSSVL